MGVVGTRPAEGKVLLVGDAAGLVNPLQGEGIAQALASGQAAARAVLDPARRRRRRRTDTGSTSTYGEWTSVTTPDSCRLVGRPRLIAGLSAALTSPIVGIDRSHRRGRSTGTISSMVRRRLRQSTAARPCITRPVATIRSRRASTSTIRRFAERHGGKT